MTGWEHIKPADTDLIIIQLGDNYRGAATVQELQLQYERLISSLKRKHEPLIVCVSTWGNRKLDPFIRKAAENQGALYVDLKYIFGNAKNRAGNDGFTHSGVKWHPNNQGMKAIASAIWSALKPELEKRNLLGE